MEHLFFEKLSDSIRGCHLDGAARYALITGRSVVLVSVSGEARRTIEAAGSATASGSATVAIVADRMSALARACDSTLIMPQPITRATPHTRDYTATLLALGVLGEHLSGKSWPALDEWVAGCEALIPRAMRWAAQMAATGASQRMWFLGSGPDRATAGYGALKFWEAGGALSWWDDLEEFAHGSQLLALPGDEVVVLATGRSWSRAAEMVPGLSRMAMHPLVVTERDPLPGVPIERQFQVPEIESANHTALVTCLAVQAITYQYACARNVNVLVPMNGAPHGQTYKDVHTEWVRKSAVEALT
jgi:glucosamine 6-phosphate synthetase-like amidotransferase/phosphosugar isomerase protein